jgi:hypothetical protein
LIVASGSWYDPSIQGTRNGGASVLLGNGDGGFQAFRLIPAGSNPFFSAVADFNGDQKADIVLASLDSAVVTVLLGNGDGTFLAPVNYVAGRSPNAVTIADPNQDGKLDLIVANALSGDISLLLGKGDGTFGPPASYYSGGVHPICLASGDLNADGNLDAVVGNYNSSSISVFLASDILNTCSAPVTNLWVSRTENQLQVKWPLSSAAFALESALTVESAQWQVVSKLPRTNRGFLEITYPLDAEQRYFRLRKP